MRQLHVFTVGTSILRNFSATGEAARLGFKPEWARLPPDHPDQERLRREAEGSGGLLEALAAYASSRPAEASAELNAFRLFASLSSLAPGDVEIILLSTDTGAGILSAEALRRALAGAGYKATVRVVGGFGAGHETFEQGLANLMEEIVGAASRRPGIARYLNATGGYKPEAAFALIAASIAGYRAAYYVHEAFRDLVVLPLPPIGPASLEPLAKDLAPLEPLGWEAPASHLYDNLGWSQEKLEDMRAAGLVEVVDGKVRVRTLARRLVAEYLRSGVER